MKDVTITIYVSEVYAEVENKTDLTGRSRSNPEAPEIAANMRVTDEDNDKLQVLRSIGNAFATLKMKLSEYISATSTSDNNVLNEATLLYLVLSVPSNFNLTAVATITSEVHQYLTNVAVADWFTITNKADAGDYATLAAANLNVIREAVNKRIRPTRTKPTVTTSVSDSSVVASNHYGEYNGESDTANVSPADRTLDGYTEGSDS